MITNLKNIFFILMKVENEKKMKQMKEMIRTRERGVEKDWDRGSDWGWTGGQ